MTGFRSGQSGSRIEGAQNDRKASLRGMRHFAPAAYSKALEELERLAFRMPDDEAVIWRDYCLFKAAGHLHGWRRLYEATIPVYVKERLIS